MYDLKGRARQTKAGLYVRLGALLANSCMEAKVQDTYPGTIIHIVDPGYAEIHIAERRRPGSQICLERLVPWYEQVLLPDFDHSRVAVLVNGKQELMLRTEEGALPLDGDKSWVVTAFVGSPQDGPFHECATHREDDIVLAIYKRVFGPETREACDAFRGKNCIESQF